MQYVIAGYALNGELTHAWRCSDYPHYNWIPVEPTWADELHQMGVTLNYLDQFGMMPDGTQPPPEHFRVQLRLL